MYGNQKPFDTYKVTFESREQAREFRNAIAGFCAAIRDNEDGDPVLTRSAEKLRHYLHRDEADPEFDFDGITVGTGTNALIPDRRYGWALDIHDIAVAVTCLSIDTDNAQTLLQDMTRGIRAVHADPSTTLRTEAGLNYGPYIQITEELDDDQLTTDHVHLALDRLYRGQGVSDFDRERYTHPSHDISDPATFVSSIVANAEVEGLGSTLPYIYDTLVDLGEDETTANIRIIIHELLRMAALNLDRPMILLGASGIEEALLVQSGNDPDNENLRLDDAVKSAYSEDIISKDIGYACTIIREIRNELGHTSWPSANLRPGEITLASSLVILVLTDLLDTPTFDTQELHGILDEFTDHHGWTVQYTNGNFTADMPSER